MEKAREKKHCSKSDQWMARMLDDVAAEWCLDGETFIGQTINSFEHGEWAAAAANAVG